MAYKLATVTDMTTQKDATDRLVEGSVVRHPSFGIGKLLLLTSDEATVYFSEFPEQSPSKRVRRFRLPTEFLQLANEKDSAFENLPPWRDGHFVGSRDDLTLEDARRAFLQHFPDGVSDQRFLGQETAYKRAAHDRWLTSRQQFASAVQQTDVDTIAATLDFVYGPRGGGNGSAERLNLMYQRVEEPVFFDALRAGGANTVRFGKSVLDYLNIPSSITFDAYVRSLAALTSRDGKPLEGWVTLTWLLFISDPSTQFLIKPTIVQRFAGSVPFDIRYRSDLNFETYRRSIEMALTIRDWLSTSDLNASGRSLDLIDVQSFMWVVERYLPGD